MFRTESLSIIRSLALYTQQQVYVIQVMLTDCQQAVSFFNKKKFCYFQLQLKFRSTLHAELAIRIADAQCVKTEIIPNKITRNKRRIKYFQINVRCEGEGGEFLYRGIVENSAQLRYTERVCRCIKPLAPELFFFKFQHTLYIKCE